MGVPKMYYFLQKYNDSTIVDENGIVGTVIKTGLPEIQEYEEITDTHAPMDIQNHLFLDFNGGIYTAFNRSNCTTNSTLIDGSIEYLDTLIKLQSQFKTLKTVFLAIDGTPPRAKIEQQRTRRFHSIDDKAKTNKLNDKYNQTPQIPNPIDTNMITPGTKFMEDLHDRFINHLDELKEEYPDIEFIYSGYKKPGEGEHKAHQYIKNKKWFKNDRIVIYGLDADLIMLGMVASEYAGRAGVYLLRERTEYGSLGFEFEGSEYLYLDINLTRQALIKEYENLLGDTILRENHNRIIDDFIFLCFILGNDFIPHIPHVSLDNDGGDYLMQVYIETYHVYRDFLVDRSTMKINHHILTRIFEILASSEVDDIRAYHKRRQRKQIRMNNIHNEYDKQMQLKNFLPLQHLHIEKVIDPWHVGWQSRYYRICFNQQEDREFRNTVVKRYLESLTWTFRYYFGDVDSWSWFYPYHYGPLCCDVVEFLQGMTDKSGITTLSNINQIKFPKGKPVKPQELLVMVLPYASRGLMCSSVRDEISKEPLGQYFPQKYKISLPYHTYYWQCRPILPIISYDVIHSLMKKIKLTSAELERNKNE